MTEDLYIDYNFSSLVNDPKTCHETKPEVGLINVDLKEHPEPRNSATLGQLWQVISKEKMG